MRDSLGVIGGDRKLAVRRDRSPAGKLTSIHCKRQHLTLDNSGIKNSGIKRRKD